jgi:uncharacterized damage-inducible protein DinB
MRTRAELAVATLESARATLTRNVERVTLEEALASGGGYRSVLGLLKHVAAWSHVYRSYAFDTSPKHWRQVEWPRGLRDTIEPSEEYLRELLAWHGEAAKRFVDAVSREQDAAFDEPRPCHWGSSAPLWDIVLMVANHWTYHAGEINAILAIARGEAWEYTEEVEENHISTAGHRVRPGWMNDAQVAAYEAYIAARDAELEGQRQAANSKV